MKAVHSKQVSVFSFIVLMVLVSCKKQESETFSNKIIYQQLLNKTEYFNSEGIDIYKINYLSDGLKIEGFIIKPTQYKPTTKLPAIIYCRGGNQSFGMLDIRQLKMMNELALQGFVVLATQLRGNIASEGIDEFGGKDLNDILRLIDIAKSLDFIDIKNINVYGISRGGMNAYQISKLSDDINAIAVVGALTNLFESSKFRPNMYKNVYLPLMGDTINNRKEYIKRSSVYWHDKINEPILILHGSSDERVAVAVAKQLIDSLKLRNKKEFQYKIFEGGNHSLSNFKKQRDSLVINWFITHTR